MSIQALGEALWDKTEKVRPAVSRSGYYYALYHEIIEMAGAYASDGFRFYEEGDTVNALAAITYGFGWLDCGCLLGIFNEIEALDELPLIEEKTAPKLESHLKEKTTRYHRMLTTALESVAINPEEESPVHEASEIVLFKAERYLHKAEKTMKTGNLLQALGELSYGYGFLDAGIRAGLLRVKKNRHLFTI
jgi:hypothetical protein